MSKLSLSVQAPPKVKPPARMRDSANEQGAAQSPPQALPDMSANDRLRSDLQVVPTLAECEAVIEEHKRSWIEAGRALAVIHDARLYLQTHPTFEAYCRQRWGWSRITAYRHIQGVRMLPAGNTPQTEREARRLRVVNAVEGQPTETLAGWDELIQVMDRITSMSSSDASRFAAVVPQHRRAATAKRLRKLGSYLGRIAWSLEGTEGRS